MDDSITELLIFWESLFDPDHLLTLSHIRLSMSLFHLWPPLHFSFCVCFVLAAPYCMLALTFNSSIVELYLCLLSLLYCCKFLIITTMIIVG